jgi:phosphoribosylformylglycinamidine cyclo-ligase
MTTYKDSGVDIDAGEELVRRIKKPVRSTFDGNVLADIGLFGSFYRANFKGYKRPVLVSSVDGVGTKLRIAVAMEQYDTVGQDLVNHCVNDILVCGAKPLYFMDYFATGALSVDVTEQVILGFVKACKENRCSLVGGETAEMPGIYSGRDFDVAGTIVGVVDEKKIVNGRTIRVGDVLIGLPSTGLHTNGYSLARRVLFPEFSVSDYFGELGCTIGEALMNIHRSYLSAVVPLLAKHKIKGMSHITGGGVEGNTMRIVPKGLGIRIDWNAWDRPPIFKLIQKVGSVPEQDMRRTFNLGIGLIFVVSPGESAAVVNSLRAKKESPIVVGEIIRRRTSA